MLDFIIKYTTLEAVINFSRYLSLEPVLCVMLPNLCWWQG